MEKRNNVKMVLYIAGACLGFIVLIIAVFLLVCIIRGTGRIEPFYDANGNVIENSISEKVFIDVNGKKNGLIIRGMNIDNPVLLFISGGPGIPEYWLNEAYKDKYPNKIEDIFTVCWWDYAGECLSYDPSIDADDLNLENLACDAETVADYLKERFGKEKIYLMGHSAGSILGIYIAQEYPDSFYCYYAMGQAADEGYGRFDEGYRFMKDIFAENGQKKELKQMENMLTLQDGKYVLKDGYHNGHWESVLLKAGCATTREMRSNITGIFFPQMLSHCYTFSEKINYWRGNGLLSKSPYFTSTVLIDDIKPVEIPVYFIHGTYDYTCPVPLAKKLYEKLDAPEKEFYEFSNSAHSPLWEENEKVLEILKQPVNYADKE